MNDWSTKNSQSATILQTIRNWLNDALRIFHNTLLEASTKYLTDSHELTDNYPLHTICGRISNIIDQQNLANCFERFLRPKTV